MSESSTAILVWGTFHFDCTHMSVCTDCYRLRGPCELTEQRTEETPRPTTLLQRCRCDASERDEPRWPRYDFNEAVCFCHSCGAVLLGSGSRWSVWFCDSCKKKVMTINHAVGRCLIPIGRHSMMNGVFHQPSEGIADPELREFAESLTNVFSRIGKVAHHAPRVVRNNCKEAGLHRSTELLLPHYLSDVSAFRRDNTAHLIDLCHALQIPIALA